MSAEEACSLILFTLAWSGGQLPVYVNRRALAQFQLPCSTDGALWSRSQRLDRERSVEVAVGLPVACPEATVLWCWVRGGEQLARARKFRPVANIVLRCGPEWLLVWGMREPVPYVLLTGANERLAYALRAPRTRCEPAGLRMPLPGTFLRAGRKRPVPVMVARADLTGFTRTAVVGRLRDAPARDAWKDR